MKVDTNPAIGFYDRQKELDFNSLRLETVRGADQKHSKPTIFGLSSYSSH